MTNVYEGPPDDRQSVDPGLKTSRFRPRYRALSHREKALHDEIKALAERLEEAFQQVGMVRSIEGLEVEGRYHALAITDLERAVMWAVKGLTA